MKILRIDESVKQLECEQRLIYVVICRDYFNITINSHQ